MECVILRHTKFGTPIGQRHTKVPYVHTKVVHLINHLLGPLEALLFTLRVSGGLKETSRRNK